MVVKPLPLDIIYLIAGQVDDRLSPLQHNEEALVRQISERQAVGRAMSRVCRSWRSIGTELVWPSARIDLPNTFGNGHLFVYSRLARLLKEVVVTCVTKSGAQISNSANVAGIVPFSLGLRRLQVSGTRSVVRQILEYRRYAITPPRLVSVSLSVSNRLDVKTANTVLETLQELTTLRHLSLKFCPKSLTAMDLPVSTRVRMPLHTFNLELPCTVHSSSQVPWTDRLLSFIDPHNLHTLFLSVRTPLSSTAVFVIRQATSLVTLSVSSNFRMVADLLPLSSVLSSLPALQCLSIVGCGAEPCILDHDVLLASLPTQLSAVQLFADFDKPNSPLNPFLTSRLTLPLTHFTYIVAVRNAGEVFYPSRTYVKRIEEISGLAQWEEVNGVGETWEGLLPKESQSAVH